MRRPRFSIAKLLAAIAFCGVAFAALRYPTFLWARVLVSLSLASLVLALINVIFSQKQNRAFWLGFLISGVAYLAILSVTWQSVFRTAWHAESERDGRVDSLLVSSALLDCLYEQAVLGYIAPSFPGDPPEYTSVTDSLFEFDRSVIEMRPGVSTVHLSPPTFRQIGHALITLLFAFAGGLYARHCYVRREEVVSISSESLNKDAT
ncbi:MAG TPA: hypothetical protein VGZ22_10760 [Isosphaeraceae bacterium]|jgi:hypothetical protein|nr:hypothetical protein [Isosphaeraceae bacterium]